MRHRDPKPRAKFWPMTTGLNTAYGILVKPALRRVEFTPRYGTHGVPSTERKRLRVELRGNEFVSFPPVL